MNGTWSVVAMPACCSAAVSCGLAVAQVLMQRRAHLRTPCRTPSDGPCTHFHFSLINQLWPPRHVCNDIVLVRQMLQHWCPHRAVSLQHVLQCRGHALLSQAASDAVIFADCQATCAPRMITLLQERGCCTAHQGLRHMRCSSMQVSGRSTL